MLYLLDTNVISNLERQRPNEQLVAWLRTVDSSEIAIPLSAIFEIEYGIELARECHPERAAEKKEWLDGILDAQDGQVLCPGIPDARLRGRMLATPALRNFIVQNPQSTKLKTGEDIAIAAMAIVRNAVVVTFNEKDFVLIHSRFPLPGLYHPGRREWVVPPNKAAVNPPLRFPRRTRYRFPQVPPQRGATIPSLRVSPSFPGRTPHANLALGLWEGKTAGN